MSWLLDTMVLSELMKERADPRVIQWLDSVGLDEAFTSALCIGELRYGIERLPPGSRRDGYEEWLSMRVLPMFGPRILGIDVSVTDVWAKLRAGSSETLPGIDALIAATALARDMTIVSRNTRDFSRMGVRLHNPWA